MNFCWSPISSTLRLSFFQPFSTRHHLENLTWEIRDLKLCIIPGGLQRSAQPGSWKPEWTSYRVSLHMWVLQNCASDSLRTLSLEGDKGSVPSAGLSSPWNPHIHWISYVHHSFFNSQWKASSHLNLSMHYYSPHFPAGIFGDFLDSTIIATPPPSVELPPCQLSIPVVSNRHSRITKSINCIS